MVLYHVITSEAYKMPFLGVFCVSFIFPDFFYLTIAYISDNAVSLLFVLQYVSFWLFIL